MADAVIVHYVVPTEPTTVSKVLALVGGTNAAKESLVYAED